MSLELLLKRIEQQRGELQATAYEAEQQRSATPRLVEALRAIEVTLVKAPKEVGGYQLSLPEQAEFYEALAYPNPTAGWVGFVHGGAGGMAGAHLPDPGLGKVFGGPMPFLAAVAAPGGKAERVDGGWHVAGRWKWASGVQHSQWAVLTALVDSTPPEARFFVIGADAFDIVDDWHVAALQGTGSVDVVADTVVAEEMNWSFKDAPKRGGFMYGATSIKAYVAGENSGFSIGVAQRAVDEAASYSIDKKRRSGGLLRDREVFRYELARADLRVGAARALMQDVLSEAWEVLHGPGWNGAIDAKVTAALAYVTAETANAVTDLYHFVGATVIHNSHVLQRCLRDLHGATQHAFASNEAYEDHGLHLIERPGDKT